MYQRWLLASVTLASLLVAVSCGKPSQPPTDPDQAVETSGTPDAQQGTDSIEPGNSQNQIQGANDEKGTDPASKPVTEMHLPGVSRPAVPEPVWNIPPVPWPSAGGVTFWDLASIAKYEGAVSLQQAREVFTAEENFTRANALAHQTSSEAGSAISTAERLELDALLDTANAELKRYGHLVADEIYKLHSLAFDIVDRKQTIAVTEAKLTYLTGVNDQVLRLIALGELPTSAADRITTKIFVASQDIEDNKIAINEISIDAGPLINGVRLDSLSLGDSSATPQEIQLPASQILASAALDASLYIAETILRIESTTHKIALLDWNYYKISSPTPQQTIEWIAAKNLEEINLDYYENLLQTEEGQIIAIMSLAKETADTAQTKFVLAKNRLTAAEKSYAQSLNLLANGEIDIFDLLERADVVFDAYLAVASSEISIKRALSSIDRLLYTNEYQLALDPPEFP